MQHIRLLGGGVGRRSQARGKLKSLPKKNYDIKMDNK